MSIRIAPSISEPGTFELTFDNPKCSRGGRCIINVVKGAPVAPSHGWNGDTDKPTITPSIGCESRGCTWHGHIINGEVRP
jgi:hypothetical protein